MRRRLLMLAVSGWTAAGFQASANLAEQPQRPQPTAPAAIVGAVAACGALGMLLLLVALIQANHESVWAPPVDTPSGREPGPEPVG